MKMNAKVVLVGLLALSACKAVDVTIVSGQSLSILADQFVATASAMDKGLDSGAITQEQYVAWAKFGKKFQSAPSIR